MFSDSDSGPYIFVACRSETAPCVWWNQSFFRRLEERAATHRNSLRYFGVKAKKADPRMNLDHSGFVQEERDRWIWSESEQLSRFIHPPSGDLDSAQHPEVSWGFVVKAQGTDSHMRWWAVNFEYGSGNWCSGYTGNSMPAFMWPQGGERKHANGTLTFELRSMRA